MATATNQTNDFVILGPSLAPGNKVFEAIHALYFLPENYKLVFTGDTPTDQVFYGEVIKLIERDELADRVSFAIDASNSHAVIGTNVAGNNVTGDSSEALASAILSVARATA